MNHLRKSLPCLLIAQSQVAFSDNASKLMLIGLAQLASPHNASSVEDMLAATMVLSVIFFAPLVGWISDYFSKRRVLFYALLFEVVIMIYLTVMLHMHCL